MYFIILKWNIWFTYYILHSLQLYIWHVITLLCFTNLLKSILWVLIIWQLTLQVTIQKRSCFVMCFTSYLINGIRKHFIIQTASYIIMDLTCFTFRFYPTKIAFYLSVNFYMSIHCIWHFSVSTGESPFTIWMPPLTWSDLNLQCAT